ncbi:LamG domain-containing protein [Streptomyces sp. NPDC033538]|uniref:LamG domain-containing protein n=1 Tax=Streptomyces sp. NPDC033538 TaxID=3155367 RepID=UPI0033E6956D
MAAAALTLPATTAHAASAGPDIPPSQHASDRARAAVTQAAQRQQGSGEADTTAPLPPRVTLAAPYTECLSNDCRKGGGPGVTAKFSFSPNEADTGIVSYLYKFSSQDSWSSVTGETATFTYTPQQSGLYRLQVQAVDETGWPGSSAYLDFMVAAGQKDIGRWHFDEVSGAALDSGAEPGTARHDATLTGGATRDDRGRRGVRTHDSLGTPLPSPVTDRGLALDGSSGYAATTGPVVDTRESYTLSAWVRPDTLGGTDRTVLAQDGGFRLSYDAARGTWALRPSLLAGADHRTLVAEQPATPEVWTHLTAVYDAPADETRLYVNGRLQATGTAPGEGAADGPLQFGRALSDGSPTEYTDYFDGSIDEVAVWQRTLTDPEIAGEARLTLDGDRNAVELVAGWSAGGATGTALTDTVSGYGPELALSGGATLDGETLVLDGVDGAAAAGGPLVDGTGSFTVSTEVTLDGAAVSTWDVGRVGQVVGRRAADGSTWGLWYRASGTSTVLDEDTLELKEVPVGFWCFGRLNADGTYDATTSVEAAQPDEPVRLTGVYDAQDGTIELYVGTHLNGDAKSFTNASGPGEFTVGGTTDGDTWTHHLPARIKDIGVWAGAMASAQQISEVTGA